MADHPISGLSSAVALTGTETMYAVQSAGDVSVTATQIKTWASASPTLVTPVVGVATGTSLAVTGALSSSGTAGIGYATGAGGTVTQITSRTTAVTLNKICGSITMFSAAGSATAATFTVNNSTVAATDTIDICTKSSTNLYNLLITAVGAGSFNVTFFTTGGTATDAPVLNFSVNKSVAA